MARRETSLSRTLLYIVGIRHTLMLPGIDGDKRGHARPDGVIRAPEGRTVKQLFVIAHEVGHVVMKHYDSNKPRHVEEYEADKYALLL
jgi:hypothetical protein